MFDMAGVAVSSALENLLNSSPSSGSGNNNSTLIKMSTSPCPSSALLSPTHTMTMSPNNCTTSTPTHQQQHYQHQQHQQQQQQQQQQHQQNLMNNMSGIAIKKEMGLLSPPGTDENCLSGTTGPTEVFNSKCKRKINFSHLGIPPRGHQPATVARRNARERNRVKQVNNGFAALKQHIPVGHRAKKMSKVETLRCAVDYIKNLKTLLDPTDSSGLSSSGESPSFETHLQHYQFDFGVSSGSGSTQQLSPTSSDDPSSPSYASEGSFVTSNGAPTQLYDYENYEPVSPEDEELLDAISWWQQS